MPLVSRLSATCLISLRFCTVWTFARIVLGSRVSRLPTPGARRFPRRPCRSGFRTRPGPTAGRRTRPRRPGWRRVGTAGCSQTGFSSCPPIASTLHVMRFNTASPLYFETLVAGFFQSSYSVSQTKTCRDQNIKTIRQTGHRLNKLIQRLRIGQNSQIIAQNRLHHHSLNQPSLLLGQLRQSSFRHTALTVNNAVATERKHFYNIHPRNVLRRPMSDMHRFQSSSLRHASRASLQLNRQAKLA